MSYREFHGLVVTRLEEMVTDADRYVLAFSLDRFLRRVYVHLGEDTAPETLEWLVPAVRARACTGSLNLAAQSWAPSWDGRVLERESDQEGEV